MDLDNRIVEYLDGTTIKLALVTDVRGSKVLIEDENGKQGKLAEKQILFIHGASNRNDFKTAAKSLREAVGTLCEEIDADLLWTELSDEGSYTADAIADLYFSDTSPVHCSAVFKTLFSDGVRYRFKNGEFSARAEEEVEAEREARRKRDEKEEQLKELRKFIRVAHQANEMLTVPESLTDWVKTLEADFLLGQSTKALAMLDELNYDQTSERLAFDVLVKTGRISPGSDDILKVSGLSREFPDRVVAYADEIPSFSAEDDREDFRGTFTFSIDDDDTREVDDAISVERLDDRVVVGVHIADVAHFVSRKDPIDEEALRRCATLYMPTGPVMMIPERISCDLASLNQGVDRPCFSIVLELDYNGALKDWRVCRGIINVERRFNYDEADLLMAMGSDGVAKDLQLLSQLMDVYMKKRLEAGSIIFSKLEQKIRVNGDDIDARAFQTDSPSRNLIAELMIQYNALTAEFATKHDIPLIFRAQVPPDQPAAKYRGQVVKDTNPNVFRGLKRGRLSLKPQTHAGLGLKAYTQVSSPLRRFGDLVMQRQLAAHLNGEDDYPYTANELLEVIGNSEAVERENREVERISTRYWELEHVRRQKTEVFPAVVMSKVPGGYIVALRPIPVRGKMSGGDRHYRFGEEIHVRIDTLVPELSVFRVKHEEK